MGLLVEGVWHDKGYDQEKNEGRFERDASLFRNWVTPDGARGRAGRAASRPRPGATISMRPISVRGRRGA
jgi:Predicted glutathione S-transferase